MQNSGRYRQKFRQEARSAETGAGASKLRFADDELPGQDAVNRKLEKAQERAARFEQRLHKAENKLPSRCKPRLETSADPATGKPKTRLRFEKEVKEKSEALKGPTALRPVKGAANLAGGMVHKQIYKNEHENVGVRRRTARRSPAKRGCDTQAAPVSSRRTTRSSVCKTVPSTHRLRRHIKRLLRKTLS